MADTERLLDLIQDDAELLVRSGVGGQASATILRCITELRRRGDTLVRAADLRSLLDLAELARKMVNATESGSGEYEAHAYLKVAVRRGQDTFGDRLENALRGDTFLTGRENT